MIELLECQDCHEKKDDVFITFCPYAQELFENEIEIQVCESCHYDRVRSI